MPPQSAQTVTTAADDLALLVQAAQAAGALSLDYFQQPVKQWAKDDDSPVSEADIAVDNLLLKTLRPARPDYGWLSEETEDDRKRLTKSRVFVVDPIDGTRAFLKGRPHYCVSLAVVEDGAPIAAALFNPATDEMFTATNGGGACLNDAPITPSNRSDITGAHLIGHESLYRHPSWPEPWPDDLTISNINSIAYTVALVAAGKMDGSVSLTGKSDWDLAAADLIMREAGGKATTHLGESYTYNQSATRHLNIISGGPAMHAALLAKVEPISRLRR